MHIPLVALAMILLAALCGGASAACRRAHGETAQCGVSTPAPHHHHQRQPRHNATVAATMNSLMAMQKSTRRRDKDSRSKECGGCFNGSYCDEETGQCVCWPHFTDGACAYLACDDNSHPKDVARNACPCLDGWSGLLCQTCLSPQVCQEKYGEETNGKNGTWMCDDSVYSFDSVHEKWFSCDLTEGELTQLVGPLFTVFWCLHVNDTVPDPDRVHRRPPLLHQADPEDTTCQLQVYSKMGYPPGEGSDHHPVGKQLEIFFCVFNTCQQLSSVDPKTGHVVNSIQCGTTRCDTTGHYPYPDFLKEQLNNMHGQGSVTCDNVTKGCVFAQDELQFQFDTNCTGQLGQCVFVQHNETRPEPPPPPPPPDLWSAMLVRIAVAGGAVGSALIAIGTCLAVHCAYSVHRRRKNYDFWCDINREGHMGAEITFRGITYNLFNGMGTGGSGTRILHGISGNVPRGSMLAIMGSSGAGKTTLLDILAGRRKGGTVGGDIFVNGQVADRKYQLMKGYVMQDNLMMETMTVRELLTFSVDLRLPGRIGSREKSRRVLQAMEDLDISHLADRLVGGLLRRGISGGEKRRVAIGMELVVSPAVLFLDEPSSGLDSSNALSVMQTLKKLSEKGQTIVFSIHQPSSNIFSLFDQLLLLGEGRCCYIGPARLAKQHFENLNYEFPSDHNPADVMVDLAIRATRHHRQNTSYDTVTELERMAHAAYHSSASPLSTSDSNVETQPLLRASRPSSSLEEAAVNINAQFQQSQVAQGTGMSARQASGVNMYLTTFYSQFWYLAVRAFKNFLRNPLLLPAHLILSTGMGIFLGVIYWQQELDFYGSQNRLGAMFFMCAMLGLGAMTSLGLFVSERAIFIRERANGYYRSEAYFFAKVLFDIIPLRAFPPILFACSAYWMIGLRPGLENFALFVGFTVLFNVVSGGICLVIGVICPNVALANILALAANLYFMLFGGFLINTDQLPDYLAPLKYTSPYQFTVEALMVNEFTGRVILFNPKGFPAIKMPGNKLLEIFGFNVLHTPMDAGILFFMAVTTIATAGILLRVFVKERL